MTSDAGELLPPGAELRVRVKTKSLVAAATLMGAAARGRSTALGPMMLRLQAVKTDDAVAHLQVSADTGEMQISTSIEGVEILEEGAVSVVLADFLAKLKVADSPGVEISVLDAEKILLRTARTRWEISGEVGFWSEETLESDKFTVVEAADLAKAVAGVLPAVPKNSGRPTLERVSIKSGWAMATSGALLLKRRIPGELFEIDLPRPVAAIVATLKDGSVSISQSAKQVSLVYDRISLLISKPLLPFPDVSKVETAAHIEDHGLLISDAGLMQAALGRVRVYADETAPEVTLRSIKTKQGWSTVMFGEDRSGNIAKEALQASWQDEKQLKATFHHQHLASALRAAGSGEVELKIATSGKSLVIETEDLVAIMQQIVS